MELQTLMMRFRGLVIMHNNMKKFNNNLGVIMSYILALMIFYYGMYLVKPDPSNITSINPWLSGISILLVLFGIFSGFKGTKEKKTGRVGYILIIIGFGMLIYALPIIFNFLLAFTPI